MRNSRAGIALIQKCINGQTLWLARWNRNWSAFSFVGGHKEDEETYRECVMREVIEELGLEPEADFVVEREPHSHLEYTAWSEGSRSDTAYTMELYPLTLTGDFTGDKILSDPQNRWLTAKEIRASLTHDEEPVSGTMALLLEMAGLLDDPNAPPCGC